MRVLDEMIILRPGAHAGDPPPETPAEGPGQPVRRRGDQDARRERRTTARHSQARRADMSATAFCVLVAAWGGALLLVLLAVLALRGLG